MYISVYVYIHCDADYSVEDWWLKGDLLTWEHETHRPRVTADIVSGF